MKRIFTLAITIALLINAKAQTILNEVYANPGNGSHEFFEFFNSGTTPVSMDNYTILSYYEEGANKGFTVLDIPNFVVAGRKYFVGSAALPFNYQGVINSTNSQYSWNDLAFMSANNAYVKRWVLGNAVPAAVDGNANYDLAVVPANFNDVFAKSSGSGASYNVFIFKNGQLYSIFLGGTGGATFIPTYILSMPSLYVDMTGASNDFTINFSSYTNAPTEFVGQDIGSDNGYIRLRDGFCNAWTKSSSQVNHTPGTTNGGGTGTTGVISVSSAISPGWSAIGSTVNYDVVGGPVESFPVTMSLFIDNGSVPGEIDATDTYLTSATENSVSDGPFSTVFFPFNANIIIQTMSSAGCLDNLRFIPNSAVLPVRFTGFTTTSNSRTDLQWYVADNANALQYEVESSTDAKNFQTTAIIFPTTEKGDESYIYKGQNPKVKTWYRIKLTDNAGKISYTKTLAVGNAMETSGSISMHQNPVESYLTFSFHSENNSLGTINIYNTSGILVYSQKTNFSKDTNTIAINLDGKVLPGIYILEVKTNYDRNSIKFTKR